MPAKTSLFIADDHQLIIDGITAMLHTASDWEIIGTANDGQAALKNILLLKPDVVLLDLDMPLQNGLQVAEQVLKQTPEQKIVILTLHYEKPIVQKLIKLGVRGYLLKNTSRDEFLEGLNMVRQGHRFYSSQLLESMLDVSTVAIQKESNVKLLSLLNEREQQILKLIAEGISSKEIGDKLHLSPATVETYRKTLLKKLNARNAADLIRLAIQEGLI
jgi:DNA-binding NarL/FixJ family response regulator